MEPCSVRGHGEWHRLSEECTAAAGRILRGCRDACTAADRNRLDTGRTARIWTPPRRCRRLTLLGKRAQREGRGQVQKDVIAVSAMPREMQLCESLHHDRHELVAVNFVGGCSDPDVEFPVQNDGAAN